MNKAHAITTPTLWQENIDHILNKRSAKKQISDQNRIAFMRRRISESTLGNALLEWADDNDIQILMDHKCNGVIGYYMIGTNTVCLNSLFSNEDLLGTLAHELRHAWQDHNGLLSNTITTPQDYATQVRFIEADAFAFGAIVAFEADSTTIKDFQERYYDGRIKKILKENPNGLNDGSCLAAAFDVFFNNTRTRRSYDIDAFDRGLQAIGLSKHSVPNAPPGECCPKDFLEPAKQGLNLRNKDSIRALGDVFGLYNYMDQMKIEPYHNSRYHGNFSQRCRNTTLHRIKNLKKQRKKQGLKSMPVFYTHL